MIKLFDVNWCSHTAGVSPVTNQFGPNCRTELFFMGCKKGAEGNPCPYCFNPKLWNIIQGCRELDPKDMAKHIQKHAPYPFVTIVGGEPFDQFEDLVVLIQELDRLHMHTIVFTHYNLITWDHPLTHVFFDHVDIVIDGEYKHEERIYYEPLQDGFHDAVGSGNQIVWDVRAYRQEIGLIKHLRGIRAEHIRALFVDPNTFKLKYITYEEDVPYVTLI